MNILTDEKYSSDVFVFIFVRYSCPNGSCTKYNIDPHNTLF
jgi:hypothetical protein